MKKIRLVAFDLDGVLADNGGSWVSVHEVLGTREHARKNASRYLKGEITFEEWAHADVQLWDGVPEDKIKQILENIPLMKGAAETLQKLKKKYVVGIISGGLSPLSEKIAREHGLDFAYGNKILSKNGRVTGIDCAVPFDAKGRILAEVAEKHGLKKTECAVVGDHLNDIPMFKQAGFSIAFNPQEPSVAENADAVIKQKDLRLILKYI